MRDELKGMRQVLRTLGHLSEEGVIQNKGRVACEVCRSPFALCTRRCGSDDDQNQSIVHLESILLADEQPSSPSFN